MTEVTYNALNPSQLSIFAFFSRYFSRITFRLLFLNSFEKSKPFFCKFLAFHDEIFKIWACRFDCFHPSQRNMLSMQLPPSNETYHRYPIIRYSTQQYFFEKRVKHQFSKPFFTYKKVPKTIFFRRAPFFNSQRKYIVK